MLKRGHAHSPPNLHPHLKIDTFIVDTKRIRLGLTPVSASPVLLDSCIVWIFFSRSVDALAESLHIPVLSRNTGFRVYQVAGHAVGCLSCWWEVRNSVQERRTTN